MTKIIFGNDYKDFLIEIKQQYRSAQLKAVYSVNKEMIQFYWQLGKGIIEKQAQTDWGTGFLKQLSSDLQNEFSGTSGFSVTNLGRMRKFARMYPDLISAQPVPKLEKSAQPVAQLPWGHICVLIQQVKDPEARAWYAENALKNGVARSVLIMQIEQNLYERQGKHVHKITNFVDRLPQAQSDLAMQLFKDPYDFRFLPVTESSAEQVVEESMVAHLRHVFLELGAGFAYMGTQYKITVGNSDFFLDMLFYNVRLHCYFLVEIKVVELKPEHVGKLNFYLTAVDELLKAPEDNPSIGLLLCKNKDKVVAEYSLKKTDGAIGIAEYLLSNKLPNDLIDVLPSIEELELKL